MQSITPNILLHQFNKTIDLWISWLNDYSFEQLCTSPKQDEWSLGQVYVHLIRDSNYYVEQMKEAILPDKDHHQEMNEIAKEMFEKNSFPDALLKNPFAELIKAPAGKEEVQNGLLLIKDSVNKLFDLTDIFFKNGKSAHPGFGFFTSLQWLQFMEMHFRHHIKQKEKIVGLIGRKKM